MPICITHTNYYRAPSHLLTQGPHGRLRAGSAEGAGSRGRAALRPAPRVRARARGPEALAQRSFPSALGGPWRRRHLGGAVPGAAGPVRAACPVGAWMDGVRDRARLPGMRRAAEGGAEFAGSRLPDPRGTAARPLRLPRPPRVPGLPIPLPRSRCLPQPCPGVGKQTGFFVGAEQRRLWRAARGWALGPCPSPVPCPCPRAPSSAGAGGATCSEGAPCCTRPCSGPSCRAHSCFPSAL